MERSALFDLIKSLTQGEKQFFRQFSVLRGERDRKHIQVFDLLDKMKTYDEETLKKKIQDPMLRKNFSVHKHYLYKIILRSLRVQYDEADVNNTLASRLQEINILNEKGLYKSCMQWIEKSEELAEKYEKRIFLYNILEWKKMMESIYRPRPEPLSVKEVKAAYRKRNALLQEINQVNTFQETYDLFVAHMNKRQVEDYQWVEETVKDKSFQAAKEAPSYCRRVENEIKGFYYEHIGQLEKGAEFSEKSLQVLNETPEINYDNPKAFMVQLYLHTGRIISLGLHEEVFEKLDLLKKLKEQVIPFRRRKFEALIAARALVLELYYYKLHELVVPARKALPGMIKDYRYYEKEFSKEYRFLIGYQIAFVWIICGDYKQGRQYLLECLHNPELKRLRTDLHISGHLLRVYSYFEEQDARGYALALKEWKAFVKDLPHISPFLEIMLNFFEMYSFDETRKKQNQLIRETAEKFDRLSHESQDQAALYEQSDTFQLFARIKKAKRISDS